MIYKYYLALFFVACTLNGVSQKIGTTPLKIKEESICNRCGNEKYAEGYDEGYKIGLADGKEEGYGEGLEDGKHLGKEQLRRDFESMPVDKKDTMMAYYETIVFTARDSSSCFDKKNLIIEEAIREFTQSDKVKEFTEAEYRRGYEIGFRERHLISLMEGQQVKLNNQELNLRIDYDGIAKTLTKVKDGSIGHIYFQEAVKEVNVNILEYLSRRLSLNRQEHNDLFSRYSEIHNKISELYLVNYLELLALRNLKDNTSSTLYNFEYHIAISAFLEVIKSGICSVADIVFTYAKSNGHFAAVNGLETTGHICELILKELMIELTYNFTQQSVINDYDIGVQYITYHCQNVVTDMVVGHEVEKISKDTVIELSDNLRATIKMDIFTHYTTGVDPSGYYCLVDHNNQVFSYFVEPVPLVLEITSQYYAIKEIKMDMTCYSTGYVCKETYKLKQKIIEELFHNNKPKIDEIIPPDLKMSQLDRVVAISVKAVEPALSISNTCYSANFNLGNKTKKLIKTKCYYR